MTVADILKAEPLSKPVLQKFGFDTTSFSCQFEEACRKNSVDPQEIKKALLTLRLSLKQSPESFGHLLDHVIRQHESIKDAILSVHEVLSSAIEHEKNHRGELRSIKDKFDKLIESFEIHLYKEEAILFPEFINLWNGGQFRKDPPPFRMEYPINTLEAEHESVKTILSDIRGIIQSYKISEHTGKYYQRVCIELESFEKKMMELIQLENQMLFPKTLDLERNYTNDQPIPIF